MTNAKLGVLAGLGAVALAAAGYYYLATTQRAAPPRSAVPAQPPVAEAPAQPPIAGAPGHPPIVGAPGHPPIAGAPQPEQREGKVQVDRTQAFTHFRVGNRNVKSIYADGPVVWVGTSGGAIRYDTRTDEFKLYDARNGLLSNGVFHVGKLRGRIVVGTSGGAIRYDTRTDEF